MRRQLQTVFSNRSPRTYGNRRRRLWFAAGLATTIILIAGAIWLARDRDSTEQYRRYTVERGRLAITVEAAGEVSPQNRISLDPPLAGRIDEILVDEGDAIKKGQVLAWISSTDRASLLDAARAQGPEEVAKWEKAYKPTPLVAPLSGFIIARLAEPGQTTGKSGTPLVMADRLIVRAQVDETDMGKIKIGQRVGISLDAYPGMRLPGRLDHLAYEARTVNNVTVYDIEVELLRDFDLLRSGMTATVAVTVAEHKDVLIIPIEALTEHEGGLAVLVEKPGKEPVLTPVSIGLSNRGEVEITEGLEENATVLISTRTQAPRVIPDTGSPFVPTRHRGRRQGRGR